MASLSQSAIGMCLVHHLMIICSKKLISIGCLKQKNRIKQNERAQQRDTKIHSSPKEMHMDISSSPTGDPGSWPRPGSCHVCQMVLGVTLRAIL